jgi:site-specific DNA-methyltransferase (adenine-specific)
VSRVVRNQVLVGDATEQLRQIPGGSIDMVLTSPPYFRLRNYEVDGQLGLEGHVEAWVTGLRTVAAECARVLVPTGSLWLNLGDTFSTHARQGATRKSLLLGPERLALALTRDGWTLRNKIVWAKTNPVPSSVRDRLSATHELIYVLVRQADYFFDLDSIREPHTSQITKRPPIKDRGIEAWRGPNGDDAAGLDAIKAEGRVGHPLGKNPGDVWRLASSSYRGAHHATFPVQLATRMLLAGCPEKRCTVCRLPHNRRLIRALGGTAVRGALGPTCDCSAPAEPGLVLDPFFGAGTTAVAAEAHGRDWLGIELNPDFAKLATERIEAARATSATSPPNSTRRAA